MTDMTRSERRKQNIAIAVMILFVLPLVFMFIMFFGMAFFDGEGHVTLSNFQFVVGPMKLRDQTTIKPIGLALRNSLLFTCLVTFFEVLVSMLAGYALSRLHFPGRRNIQTGLLVLRMFPNLLLLIAVLYVLMVLQLVIEYRITHEYTVELGIANGGVTSATGVANLTDSRRLFNIHIVLIYISMALAAIAPIVQPFTKKIHF